MYRRLSPIYFQNETGIDPPLWQALSRRMTFSRAQSAVILFENYLLFTLKSSNFTLKCLISNEKNNILRFKIVLNLKITGLS